MLLPPGSLLCSCSPLLVLSSARALVCSCSRFLSLCPRLVHGLVAAAAGFVGVKMVLEYFYFHISSPLSLGIIALLLLVGTLASLHHNRKVAKVAEDFGSLLRDVV